MTASVADIHAARSARAAGGFAERIRCARTVELLDTLRVLVGEARGRRITVDQHAQLVAAIDAKRVVLDMLAPVPDPDSPHWHCGLPMRREIGVWPDPDRNGLPIVDEKDVCRVCGSEWPVLGDEWDRPEIRRRIDAVRAHDRAMGGEHFECKDDQPCRGARPGLRYLQAVPSA